VSGLGVNPNNSNTRDPAVAKVSAKVAYDPITGTRFKVEATEAAEDAICEGFRSAP
jgi:hypothetical protein